VENILHAGKNINLLKGFFPNKKEQKIDRKNLGKLWQK
jgi:hypothetical protein